MENREYLQINGRDLGSIKGWLRERWGEVYVGARGGEGFIHKLHF